MKTINHVCLTLAFAAILVNIAKAGCHEDYWQCTLCEVDGRYAVVFGGITYDYEGYSTFERYTWNESHKCYDSVETITHHNTQINNVWTGTGNLEPHGVNNRSCYQTEDFCLWLPYSIGSCAYRPEIDDVKGSCSWGFLIFL